MNPHQKNKIDLNSLSSDEQRLFRLYGKLPNKKDLLQNKLKERKYFDSGDYALSKAGKAGDSGVTNIGTEHPRAEDVHHSMHPLTNTLSRGDSVSSASPPPHGGHGSFSSMDGSTSNASVASPAGMHRGSINGTPGANLSSASQQNMISRSPNKEISHLARSSSLNEENAEQDATGQTQLDTEEADVMDTYTIDGATNSSSKTEGIPIRR